MRRLGISFAATLVAVFMTAAPVSATPPTQVTITTTITDIMEPGVFTATGLPDCDTGLAYTFGAIIGGGPSGTMTFHVLKLYDCDDSDNAFIMRIEAVKPVVAGVNWGSWQIWHPSSLPEDIELGAFENLYGGGRQFGEYPPELPGGIIDHMTGKVHFER